MTLHNSKDLPYVDYELTYIEKGKQVKIWGKAKARLDSESQYQDCYVDNSYPTVTVPTYSKSKITLDLVMDEGKLYTMKMTDEAKPMETVKRTIKVGVPDKTFASISDARKRAGVPRKATFSLVDLNPRFEGDTGFGNSKAYVEFSWEELL